MKFSKISALILVAVFSIAAQYSFDGMVAWYPFNDSFNDESGFENHLRYPNPTAPTTTFPQMTEDKDGNPRQAVNFSYPGQYLTASDAEFPLGDSPRTIAFWLCRNTHSSFIWYGDTLLGETFHISMRYASGLKPGHYLDICFAKDTTLPNSKVSFRVGGTSELATKEWRHLAVTYGTGSVKLYLNGEFKEEASIPSINTKSRVFIVGGRIKLYFESPDLYFVDNRYVGKLDDILIYNRDLSASEIQQLYNGDVVSVKFPTTLPTILPTTLPISYNKGRYQSYSINGRLLQIMNIPKGLYISKKMRKFKIK